MSERPRLFLHCQHSLGLGHLVRSYALAAALAEEFDVTLARGGAEPAGIEAPEGVEIVQLPALTGGVDGELSSSGGDVAETIERRRAMLLETFERLAPAVLIIELFPFGRKKLAPELLPLLEKAASAGCRVICSVRDLLVDRGEGQSEHDERACLVLNAFFDAVLVHADPAFARLEESFAPRTPLRVPVEYTGFVVPLQDPPAARPATPRIVVSAGGGAYGEELLAAAIRARAYLDAAMELRVIVGPFAAEATWERLQRIAAATPGVELVRHVPDLDSELAGATASLSQCGYNTALALLRSGVPALVVPFSIDQENEQARRAERLASLGAVRVLDQAELDPQALARELEALIEFAPARPRLRLDGAAATVQAVARIAATRHESRRSVDWLEPLRRALAARDTPTPFFFRDDDAGWQTPSLLHLLDLFDDAGAPIDLAAIPLEVDDVLAAELTRRICGGALIRLHQHGFAHANHEPSGKKCEFGPARSGAQQRTDLVSGRERLHELLGEHVDPIFTPPWNRCTQATVDCLEELGFAALSRDGGAKMLVTRRLVPLPVSVDWFGRTRRARTRGELALAVASAVSRDEPVGVMLHHADLGLNERVDTTALLKLLAASDRAEFRPMQAFVAAIDPTEPYSRRKESSVRKGAPR